MKKRVVEFVSTMDVGGIESFVKDICLTINKNVFDVMLISVLGRRNTPNERMLDNADVIIHYLYDEIRYDTISNSKLRAVLDDRKCTIRLIQLLWQWKPDILHIHGNEARIAQIIHFIPRKTKIFIHVHSEPQKVIIELDRVSVIKKILRYRKGQLIALQPNFAEQVDKIFGIDNTLVLPNCVDLERFKNAKKNREQTRDKLGINTEAFVVGHIGNFRDVKNHSFLVDIFEKVIQRECKAFLLMVGEGVLEKKIHHMIYERGLEENYMILRRRDDIPDLLGTMDVYVMPSKYEGFPVSLIEAQAAGLKCVVSDTITCYSFVSKEIIPIKLTDSTDIWADAILGDMRPYHPMNGLDYVDKKAVVRRLEEIYIGG